MEEKSKARQSTAQERRKTVYTDDRICKCLEEEHKKTGASISELIMNALRERYPVKSKLKYVSNQ